MMRRTGWIAATVASLLLLPAMLAWASGGGGGGDMEEFKPKIYRAGVKAIRAGDFKAGVDLMTKAVAETPKDADAFNYLGYAYRKLKDYDNAVKFYTRALELDPDHRGAHEYLGEAYLELNNLEEAKKHLAALDKICWLPCSQYSDLKAAVKAYEQKGSAKAY